MGLRAYYEQTNRHGVVDRIEIEDPQYSDNAFQLKGDGTGFSFQHDEITSESSDGQLNVHANKIQVGKLDFRPRIQTTEGETLLQDIRDSSSKRFTLTWKRDGSIEWVGYITTRIFQYPEKSTEYFARIRATDFELLKGSSYPLTTGRQTLIETMADIFTTLGLGRPIKTATSWVEENVTQAEGGTTYDFLGEIHHDREALRNFGRSGDEEDTRITNFAALEHLAEPALLIKQVGGYIQIDQLSALATPQTVNETIYNPDGTVQSATQTVDRRQTGYKTVDNGTPVVTVDSTNDSYPPLQAVTAEFNHRSQLSFLRLPSTIVISGTGSESYSRGFSPTGSQKIDLSFSVRATYSAQHPTGEVDILVRQGQYYWDGSSWTTDTSARVNIALTGGGLQNTNGDYVYVGSANINTDEFPNDANATTEVVFNNAIINASPDQVADETLFENISLSLKNLQDSEANSSSIAYELTQTGVSYIQRYRYGETWFGDGPSSSSPSALRYTSSEPDITSSTWQRRGATDYRSYHENLLKEILDLQRTSTRKLEAKLWGSYDPSKVLSYDGSFLYYAAGKYDATVGKWQVTLLEITVDTATTDIFDDISKFDGTTGVSTSGISASSFDDRYFRQSNNLSEGDGPTILNNLGITATDSELNTLDGATLSTAELNILDGLAATTSELNTLSGITATTSELNILDGVTVSTADINSITDGIDIAINANNVQFSAGLGDEINFAGGTGLTVSSTGNSVQYDFDGSTLAGEGLAWDATNQEFDVDGASLAGSGLDWDPNNNIWDVVIGASDVDAVSAENGGTFEGDVNFDDRLNMRADSSSDPSQIWWVDEQSDNRWSLGTANSSASWILERYGSAGTFIENMIEATQSGSLLVEGGNQVWHSGIGNSLAGTNLSWDGSSLNATDTTYSAGTNINIDGSNNINVDNSPTFSGTLTAQGGIDVTGGSVNIGSPTNNRLLNINGGGSFAGIELRDTAQAQAGMDFISNGSIYEIRYRDSDRFDFYSQTFGDEVLSLLGNGNVGIQKPNATEALDVNGNINVSGVSFASDHEESDSRIKSNITDTDPLKVAGLAQLKTFDHRDKEGEQMGLIADHFDNAHPSLIAWKKDKEFGEIRTLSTYGLASTALAGVGKLNHKVESNKKKIERLQSENKDLKQELQQLRAKVG